MKKLLKEPLIHFLILGLGLFLLFSMVSPEERDNRIIIDEYDLNEIIAKWNMQWQRDPTAEELKGLLDQYIKEEIFYREALSMNLDHNDEIIRRRLSQKMKFLAQDIAETTEPDDKILQEFLEKNQEKYMREKRITFEHKFFSRDLREDPVSDASNAKDSESITGDPISIKKEFSNESINSVRSVMGMKFVEKLDLLTVSEQWQGPIESGYGVHLVRITEVIPSEPLSLDEAREAVLNDYRYETLNRFNDDLYSTLLEQYEVIIDLEDEQLNPEKK